MLWVTPSETLGSSAQAWSSGLRPGNTGTTRIPSFPSSLPVSSFLLHSHLSNPLPSFSCKAFRSPSTSRMFERISLPLMVSSQSTSCTSGSYPSRNMSLVFISCSAKKTTLCGSCGISGECFTSTIYTTGPSNLSLKTSVKMRASAQAHR